MQGSNERQDCKMNKQHILQKQTAPDLVPHTIAQKDLANVLGPIHSFLQRPAQPYSKEGNKRKKTRQLPDPSLSMLTIIQNMPRFEQVNIYFDSFDDSQIDLRFHEISRFFNQSPSTKPSKPRQEPIQSQKNKYTDKQIPSQFIQSLIQQQKRASLNPVPTNLFVSPQIQNFRPIEIENASTRRLNSPQSLMTKKSTQSKRSQERPIFNGQITDRQPSQKRVPQPVQKHRRTNSNYNPYQAVKQPLKLNNISHYQSPAQHGSHTTREQVRSTELQQIMLDSLKAYNTFKQYKPIEKNQPRTKSIEQNKRDMSPNMQNVYVSGCHKKVPSLYALNNHNLVNIFMEELKYSMKQTSAVYPASVRPGLGHSKSKSNISGKSAIMEKKMIKK